MKVRRLDVGHDWTFGRGLANYALNSEAIAQCVKTALLSLRTDWFLDQTHGVDWFSYLRKTPNLIAMESELKSKVLAVEGVVRLVDFDISLDANTRECTVSVGYTDIFNQTNEVTANVADH